LASELGSERREGRASELDGLWSDLRRTLARLESLAGAPAEQLAWDGVVAELARLRYALHLAAERSYGLEPELDELTRALADARDATTEVAEELEAGVEPALLAVHEWRGALFRVRLARLRLDGPRARTLPEREPEPRILAPLAGLMLTVTEASVFVLGATFAAWPLWLAGVLAVAGGLLAHRP
jgi:hypothetical protein